MKLLFTDIPANLTTIILSLITLLTAIVLPILNLIQSRKNGKSNARLEQLGNKIDVQTNGNTTRLIDALHQSIPKEALTEVNIIPKDSTIIKDAKDESKNS